MSILQDLDPQYAKIHTQPSSASKPIIMVCAALIALGSAYWILMKTSAISANQTHAEYSSQPPAATNAAAKSPSAGAGATIRENPQGTAVAEQRTPMPAPIGSPENTTPSLANGEYRRQTQAPSSRTKTAPTQTIAKPERKSTTTQQAAKDERSQPHGGKRTNERDVDIITAIVR